MCGSLSLVLVVSVLAACTDRAGDPSDAVGSGTASEVANAPAGTSVASRTGGIGDPEGGAAATIAPDVVFRTLAGETLALREAAGPVLVNFWSTSCVTCLREMPALARLRDDHAPRGFELVAVAMPHDRPDAVLELAEARGWPFPVALDIDGAVLAAFEPVPGTPTSFLIDADGRVLERHVGPADVEALGRTLDTLLGDGAATSAHEVGTRPPLDAPPWPTPATAAPSPSTDALRRG